MVMLKLHKIMTLINSLILILLVIGACSGCQSLNYQAGDISQRYCMTQNEQIRVLLKATLTNYGVNVGVDYCTIHGFVNGVIHE